MNNDDKFGGILMFSIFVSVGLTLVAQHWIGDKYLLAGIAILTFIVCSFVASTTIWGD